MVISINPECSSIWIDSRCMQFGLPISTQRYLKHFRPIKIIALLEIHQVLKAQKKLCYVVSVLSIVHITIIRNCKLNAKYNLISPINRKWEYSMVCDSKVFFLRIWCTFRIPVYIQTVIEAL